MIADNYSETDDRIKDALQLVLSEAEYEFNMLDGIIYTGTDAYWAKKRFERIIEICNDALKDKE